MKFGEYKESKTASLVADVPAKNRAKVLELFKKIEDIEKIPYHMVTPAQLAEHDKLIKLTRGLGYVPTLVKMAQGRRA